MATSSDFTLVTFNEHLGDNFGDLNVPWATFVGNESTLKKFSVDGTPTGTAYILLQCYDVGSSSHRVVLNGVDLGGFDIPADTEEYHWQTWMDVIDSVVLKKGTDANTIKIVRARGGDNFVVGSVAIHWRECN